MDFEINKTVPDDWSIKSISDVCINVTSGGTPSRRKPEYYENGKYNWIKTKELDNGWIRETEEYITEEALNNSSAKLLPENTVLLAMYGATVGELGILASEMTCNQACCAMIVDPEQADYRYLFYLLLSQKSNIKSLATGAAQQNLSAAQIKSFRFPFPEIEKQKEIAQIIGDLDDKIELNRQTNQTLEQIAQAIFKTWFVDFEPVKAKITAKQNGQDPELAAMFAISGKIEDQLKVLDEAALQQLKTTAALFPDALVESELGEIPEGWEAKPLYETAEYINGAAFKSKDFTMDGEGLPIIKIAELKGGISAGTKFTNETYKDKYFIQNDDVLYSWSGSPETSLEVFKWFGGNGWLNQHIFKLNFESQDQKYFTYYLLKHMKPVLIATAQQKQTTGLGHITVADMKRIKITLPSSGLLHEFMSYVSPMYEKGSNTEKESKALIEIRDSFLPKLLSGEIEFKNKEVRNES